MEVFGGVIEVATAAGQTTSVFMLRSWDEARRRMPANFVLRSTLAAARRKPRASPRPG
jgi:hypothetical protein